MRTATQV